jgi:hypothetical protein
MTERAQPEPRVMIVVSRDTEELSLAGSFLRGQHVAAGARILLPDNLYAAHREGLPAPALQYATLDNILRAVDEHQPDLVCLFSGYLLNVEKVLSFGSVETLLHRLRDRGCRMVTSDPLLGLLSRLTLAQVDAGMLALGEPGWKRWLNRVAVRLRGKVIDVPHLDDVTHLYPTSIPRRDDRVPRVAFFNPASVGGAGESQAGGDGQGQGGSHTARPRWLFTLSAMELQCQEALLGPREFTEILLGMLRYAVAVERDPTLIAPPSIVHRLANALPSSVELLSFCPPVEFEMRLLDAEYLFSWNAFSVSHLARIANELAVFLFDRGYYSRTIKPFYAIARECHFGGWEPSYVDQRQLFSPYVLAHLAKPQKPVMRALRERWQLSPTPDQLVDQLMRAGIGPELG